MGEINRAVNTSIKWVADWAQHGLPHLWSTPVETLASEAGDCEDYVVLKYQALIEAGVTADDLRVVIVDHLRRREGHAVLAVRSDDSWLILDNLTMVMVHSVDAKHYRPRYVLVPAEMMPLRSTRVFYRCRVVAAWRDRRENAGWRPRGTATTTSTTTTTTSPGTGTGGAATRPVRAANEQWYPDHAIMNATKDQLKAMPAFKYN